MHIAIFNWRDIRHPQAGGAEVVTYETARRWAQDGHRVTWFAAAYPGGAEREAIDGIQIVRRGSQLTVYWRAWRFYRRELRGAVDVVIDQINTIPFFTPLYVKEKAVGWVHQLAREVWWYESPFPISLIGYLLEPLYWQVYRWTPFIVGAASIEEDLRRLGMRRFAHFTYGRGIQPLAEPPGAKPDPPTVLYVGRIVPSKRVIDIIEAAAHAHEAVPELRLMIAGYDRHTAYVEKVHQRIAELGMEDNVAFLGRVSEEEKRRLMQEAHLIAMASAREGWGLVVIEANALGTPAVVYDVPGLRDSVQHNATGLICRENTASALGEAIVELLLDRPRLRALSRSAWEYSQQFSWDRMADEMMRAIESVT
jgi:glycosyltransferase involved in cell wall biosynthesis